MTDIPFLFAGDSHGDWRQVHRACRDAEQPGVLVLLGDYDLDEPLADALDAEIVTGWIIRWIIGNHDTDTVALYDNLIASMPDDDLGSRSMTVDGLNIGGLGGTFRGRVWYPRSEASEPQYHGRGDYMRQLRPPERWRGGLPLSMRSAIFPEDVEALWHLPLDILVAHEAPQTKAMAGKGFFAIDDLLDATGARLCVHGHHHTSYTESITLPSGHHCWVRGLGIGEVWQLDPTVLG